MKSPALPFLKACTLSIALLGSAALVAGIVVGDPAYAKSGNENGNGGGNSGGSGNGNSGGKGSDGTSDAVSGGTSNGTGTTKDAAATKAKVKDKSKKTSGEDLGLSASEPGALNAARANPNALKNAAPNSRVGRIAAYRDSVLAGRALQADLDARKAELAGLAQPARASTEVQPDLTSAAQTTAEKAKVVADLTQALADAGGTDSAIEADLQAAEADLAAARQAEAALQDEYDAALTYETLEAEVDDLAQQVEDQPKVERALLEAAANKPVTDAVEAAVRQLLGL